MRTKKIIDIIKWFFVAIVCLFSIVPILFVVVSSFKLHKDIFQIPPKFIFAPTLNNYYMIFESEPDFVLSLGNSAIVTLIGMVFMLIVCTFAGYAYSRYNFMLRKQSAFALIAIRLLPPIIVTIPLYPILKSFGMIDSVLVLVLLYVTMEVSLGVWIMKSFIDSVPIDIEEAAKIDGASTLQAFFRITLPNAYPGLMALMIFFAVYAWNEFPFAFIFTQTKAVTAPLIISRILNAELGLEWGVLFACTTIQMIPIIGFFWMIQKYLVRSMTFGAIKG
jgi:multiple sugar transport system permease protein